MTTATLPRKGGAVPNIPDYLPRGTGQPLARVGRFTALQSEDVPDHAVYVAKDIAQGGPRGRTWVNAVDTFTIFVNAETWKTIVSKPGTIGELFKDMGREGKGMGLQLLVRDTGYYADALRSRSAQDSAEAAKTNPLAALEKELNQLIYQAATVGRASSGQMEIFGVRYAEAQEKFRQLERDIEKLRSVLQLACVAVTEAA